MFEGGWTCSPECTEARLQMAVGRELDGQVNAQKIHRHRIPLGLLMLERGWITSTQLRRAVDAQRSSGNLRIGEWLVRQGATDEAMVTRALSMQWGCPVLSPKVQGLTGSVPVLPRLFIEAFGVMPLEAGSGRMLYLGFEQSVDQALAFSVERIGGKRVECGIVQSSVFRNAQGTGEMQKASAIQLAEATSSVTASHVLAKAVERARPVCSRLVRVHEWLWMRMILRTNGNSASNGDCISDVLCRVGSL
jgi:hypothetical protein